MKIGTAFLLLIVVAMLFLIFKMAGLQCEFIYTALFAGACVAVVKLFRKTP